MKTKKSKVIPIETHDKFEGRTPLAECRKLLKADERNLSDEEVLALRDFIHCLAKMYHDYYMRCKRGLHKSRVITFDNQSNDEKESHSIRQGEYRRAS